MKQLAESQFAFSRSDFGNLLYWNAIYPEAIANMTETTERNSGVSINLLFLNNSVRTSKMKNIYVKMEVAFLYL